MTASVNYMVSGFDGMPLEHDFRAISILIINFFKKTCHNLLKISTKGSVTQRYEIFSGAKLLYIQGNIVLIMEKE